MIQPRTSNRDPTKAKPDLEKYLCGKIVFNRAGAYGVPFDLGHGPRETPWGDLGNASSTPLHMDALATRLQTKGENWTGLRWSTYSSIPNEQTSTSKHQENTQHPHLCPCLWTPTYAIHPPPWTRTPDHARRDRPGREYRPFLDFQRLTSCRLYSLQISYLLDSL